MQHKPQTDRGTCRTAPFGLHPEPAVEQNGFYMEPDDSHQPNNDNNSSSARFFLVLYEQASSYTPSIGATMQDMDGCESFVHNTSSSSSTRYCTMTPLWQQSSSVSPAHYDTSQAVFYLTSLRANIFILTSLVRIFDFSANKTRDMLRIFL